MSDFHCPPCSLLSTLPCCIVPCSSSIVLRPLLLVFLNRRACSYCLPLFADHLYSLFVLHSLAHFLFVLCLSSLLVVLRCSTLLARNLALAYWYLFSCLLSIVRFTKGFGSWSGLNSIPLLPTCSFLDFCSYTCYMFQLLHVMLLFWCDLDMPKLDLYIVVLSNQLPFHLCFVNFCILAWPPFVSPISVLSTSMLPLDLRK
jgi:hypothetical protein